MLMMEAGTGPLRPAASSGTGTCNAEAGAAEGPDADEGTSPGIRSKASGEMIELMNCLRGVVDTLGTAASGLVSSSPWPRELAVSSRDDDGAGGRPGSGIGRRCDRPLRSSWGWNPQKELNTAGTTGSGSGAAKKEQSQSSPQQDAGGLT